MFLSSSSQPGRGPGLWASLLVAASLLAASSTPALAGEAPPPPEQGPATASTTESVGDFHPDEVRAVAEALDMSENEAERSLRLTPDVDTLERAAHRRYPDSFAGLWRDNSQGGAVVLMFTGSASERAAELSTTFADPKLVQGVLAQNSLKTLRQIERTISKDLDSLNAEGIHVTVLGLDVPGNRVDVRLSSVTEEAVAALQQRYGADVLTISEQAPPTTTACTREACGPIDGERLRGGLYVYGPRGNVCTTAFPAVKGYNGSANSGIDGFLTAGHCFGQDSWVAHNGYYAGFVRWWQFSGNQDSAWIDKDDNWPNSSRWVWQLPDDTRFSITSRADAGAGNPGDPICHSGWRRGYRCGALTSDSITITVEGGIRLTDMKEDNICAGPGDSGGPVYSGRQAHGIMSASNIQVNQDGSYRCLAPERTYYSGIFNVEQALQVRVRTWF